MFPNYVYFTMYILSSLHAKYLFKNILLSLYEIGSTYTLTFNKDDDNNNKWQSRQNMAKCAFAKMTPCDITKISTSAKINPRENYLS